MAKVTAREVVKFFKDADAELASLVLDLGASHVNEKLAKKAAASERMAKARAGRKGGPRKKAVAEASPANTAAGEQAPTGVAAEGHGPIAQARARRATAGSGGLASVPAPAHTAAATSVESDTVI